MRNVYNSNGAFMSELWYIHNYGDIPSVYRYHVDNDDDFRESSSIQLDTIKDRFTKIDSVRIHTTDVLENENSNDDDSYVLPGYRFDEAGDLIDSDNTLYIAADHKVIMISEDAVAVYYQSGDSLEDVKTFAKDLFYAFPQRVEKDKTAKMGLIKMADNDYYVSFSSINKVTINLEENYNDDFLPVYHDIANFLNSSGSGLALIYGTCGTGKTSLIRHLCSNIPKNYVIVPNAIASRLGDPEFISFLTSCHGNVFILEDCEQLLMDREDNSWNNAISTILNMADGLLSDIVNIKFICTFNSNIDKIDPALLRKGRCFAKYEFKHLTEDKVAHLNEKYNLGITDIKPMTLAEIYNTNSTDYTEQKQAKIGF